MLSIVFCSRPTFVSWLQNHLIPCPFKFLTGIDCPGCGFQRSLLQLFRGNFHDSFILYPPTIPLLLFFSYGIADSFLKLDNSAGTIKKTLFIVNGSIIMVSYAIKMWGLYAHHSALA